MAALVLGTVGSIAGSAIGGPIGGSIGYLIGSTIGSLIDPPKVEGPRLEDLKLQRSSYGVMIPILYGTKRVAGNVIWQTDLEEHKQKSGGKGGPQVTTYTYSASWAVAFCEGPIQGLRKMWIDGRLVSSTGESTDELPFVLYLGTETQLPDPTIEAEEGAGEVPAHRGMAYLVFTDIFLTDYGNRIFQLEAEIEATGDSRLTRVSTFYPTDGGNSSFPTWGTFAIDGAYLDGNQVVVCHYEAIAAPQSTYQEFRYNLLTGALEETGPLLDIDNPFGSSLNTFVPSTNSSVAAGKVRASGSDVNNSRWYVAGQRGTVNIEPPSGQGINDYFSVQGRPFVHGGFVYAAGGGDAGYDFCFVAKWGIEGSTISGIPEDDYYDVQANQSGLGTFDVSPDGVAVTIDNEGYLWVGYSTLDGVNPVIDLVKVDTSDMSLVKIWTVSSVDQPDVVDQMESSFAGIAGFTVYRGLLVIGDSGSIPGEAVLWQIPDDVNDPFVQVPDIAVEHDWFQANQMPFVSLGGGYVICYDGILRVGAIEILGNMVADVSERCGLTSAQYDVSDLTEEVYGAAIASQMTGKNAIDAWRPLYLFDGAEVDDLALFRHRNWDPVDEIPDDDLGVHDYGSQPPALLEHIRTPDSELPRTVNLVYLNPDTDYQAATQYARRETGNSELDTSINVPVVLVDAEARERVNAILYSAWVERTAVAFTLTRKWAALHPIDIVTIQGYRVRLTQVNITTKGIVRCGGLITRAVVFDQTSIILPPGGGFTPPPGTGTTVKAVTELVLLDIPLQSTGDYIYGFYAAAGPIGNGSWPGYTLYKSVDGGTIYKEIASTDLRGVIGETTTAAGPFTAGSPSYDEVGFTVLLTDEEAELTSCSAAAIENNQNKFAISSTGGIPWTFGYFRTATLTASRTYDLTGIRWEDESIGVIASGATFVLMDDVEQGEMILNVDAPASELNLPFLYKAVTWGKTLAETTAVEFTNTGEGADSAGPPLTAIIDTFIGDNLTGPAPRKGLVPAPYLGAGAEEAVLIATEDGSGSPSSYWGVPSWAGAGAGDPFIGDNLAGPDPAEGLVPAPPRGSAAIEAVLLSTWDVNGSPSTYWGVPSWSGSSAADAFLFTFGTGTQGALVFDGVNAVTGFSRVGTVYTCSLANAVDATSIQIDSGVTVYLNGGQIFCTGAITGTGTIASHANRNASGSTAGGGLSANTTGQWTGSSSSGAAGTIGAGNATGPSAQQIGGSGGNGGAAGGAGGTGGVVTGPTVSDGGLIWPHTPIGLMTAMYRQAGQKYGGGGGGGGGRGDGANTGGGGGGGGGLIWICTKQITGAITIDAAGGAGAQSPAGTNMGGGGGGGGGVIFMVTSTVGWDSIATATVDGGLGGAGRGTGSQGNQGSSGRICQWIVASS